VEIVARGLASFVDGTGEVLGPSDVEWIGETLYVLTEGGGCTRGLPHHPAGILRVNRNGSSSYVADVTAFIRANPVLKQPECGPAGDCEPDGVPHSMVAGGPYLYVVETNHNSILRVNPRTGHIRRLHDLSVEDPAPIRIIRSGDDALIGTFDGDLLGMSLFGGPVSFLESGLNPVVDLVRFCSRPSAGMTRGRQTPAACSGETATARGRRSRPASTTRSVSPAGGATSTCRRTATCRVRFAGRGRS
jgi:hypothetical protein